MTRPLPQAQAFAKELQRRIADLSVVYSPVLKIESSELPALEGYRGLIFTSQNAVRTFARLSARRDLPAYTLGPRTTQTAQELGLDATQVGQDAKTLVASLPGKNPPTPLCHLHGEHTRGDVAARLSAGGVACDGKTIYRQTPVDLTQDAKALLQANQLIAMPIFSPRSAELLSTRMAGAVAPLAVAWMSDAVRDAWTGPQPVAEETATTPDGDALCDAILGTIATALQLESRSLDG